MENKRIVSILIPYINNNDKILVYLQKRAKNASRIPGYFGFWGGGEEPGENPDQTLEREIKEELGIDLKSYEFFGKYEQKTIKNVYTIKVHEDFEKKIKINEGDYGKWFSEEDVLNEPKLIDGDKVVLNDFYKINPIEDINPVEDGHRLDKKDIIIKKIIGE